MSALPTFLVIGAMKSGTGSLHRYLGEHPDIDVSEPKELDYFASDKHQQKSVEWYASHFDAAFEARGESAPNYTKCHHPPFDGVPERVHELLPEVKLVYVLRDPVERVVSHYMHNYASDRESRSFEEVLAVSDHYVKCSRYHMQLQAWLEYFPLQQIHLLTSRELRQERRRALEAIFRFLEVDPAFRSPAFLQEHHRSSKKKKPTTLDRWLGRLNLKRAVRRALPALVEDAARDAYRRLMKRPFERPQLTGPLREQVCDALADDVRRLRELTGCDFAHWSV